MFKSDSITNVGKLYINNKLFKEYAEIEFEDDGFTNRKRLGTFKVDFITAEFENNFYSKKQKFRFLDSDNNEYRGIIYGIREDSQVYSRVSRLNFALTMKQQYVRYSSDRCKTLNIYFGIPYCSLLSRRTKMSYGFYPEYIVKFIEEPFKIVVDGFDIVFDDSIDLVDINKNKGIIKRYITPSISLEFKHRSKLITQLNQIEKIMTDVMIVLTFYFNHKIDWYSYNAQLLNRNKKLFEFLKYKNFEKNIGKEYEVEDKHSKFEEYKNSNIINELILKYRQLSTTDKKLFDSFVNDLAEIKDINSLKSRRSIALFILDAICNYMISKHKIVYRSGNGYSNYQEKIRGVMKFFEIDSKLINFSYSNVKTKRNIRLWQITNLRNSLAHADSKLIIESIRFKNEYVKLLKLIRILLFMNLEPKYREIPYPEIFV